MNKILQSLQSNRELIKANMQLAISTDNNKQYQITFNDYKVINKKITSIIMKGYHNG